MSSAEIEAISSLVSAQSKMEMFWAIRAGLAGFGIATTPSSMYQLNDHRI